MTDCSLFIRKSANSSHINKTYSKALREKLSIKSCVWRHNQNNELKHVNKTEKTYKKKHKTVRKNDFIINFFPTYKPIIFIDNCFS